MASLREKPIRSWMNLPRPSRSDWKEILKMLRPFRLEEPESVNEASELLGRFGESAKVYAGGTELLLAMKEGLVHYERLVNIKKLALNDIKRDNGTIKIGALCTHHQLETSPVLQQQLP